MDCAMPYRLALEIGMKSENSGVEDCAMPFGPSALGRKKKSEVAVSVAYAPSGLVSR